MTETAKWAPVRGHWNTAYDAHIALFHSPTENMMQDNDKVHMFFQGENKTLHAQDDKIIDFNTI